MRKHSITRITATRIAVAGIAAASLTTAVTIGTGQASADGFPNGPYCHGPVQVMAESAVSQVVICPVQGPTGWAYSGKAKTTGNWIDVWGATQNSLGFHATNDGYTYHVHRDRLMITAPNGSVVSSEPWTYYYQR
ncbi:hypothetical protein [Gordonia liuliyuniae]|uniref:Peptidase inhibitor family I36 n=1 Tax=Gordonia liuliyuniae TaxID=2911517 RepID=A0ABS9IPV4_9ACTN|nr:hypothetical protein [Gordonia liuliyuniae]MCF8587589.1 hypothetical protein [Gordonia liuliyuniae]